MLSNIFSSVLSIGWIEKKKITNTLVSVYKVGDWSSYQLFFSFFFLPKLSKMPFFFFLQKVTSKRNFSQPQRVAYMHPFFHNITMLQNAQFSYFRAGNKRAICNTNLTSFWDVHEKQSKTKQRVSFLTQQAIQKIGTKKKKKKKKICIFPVCYIISELLHIR